MLIANYFTGQFQKFPLVKTSLRGMNLYCLSKYFPIYFHFFQIFLILTKDCLNRLGLTTFFL